MSAFAPSPPFSDPDHGDLILRSTDDAVFHVHRLVLSLASPVFEGMFLLPQPLCAAEDAAEVRMPHSGVVLDRVLRFFYPGAQPIVGSLGELHEILEILEILINRYEVKSVITHGRVHLRTYLVNEPVRVFAAAVGLGWNDVAREAAKECLKLPLRASDYEPPEELHYISGTTYQRLIQYHYRCGQAGKAGCQQYDPRPQKHLPSGLSVPWPRCHNCTPDDLWLREYRDRISEKISVTPVPSVQDSLLEIKVMEKAENCALCRGWAETLLTEGWLIIQAEIAKVEWKLEL